MLLRHNVIIENMFFSQMVIPVQATIPRNRNHEEEQDLPYPRELHPPHNQDSQNNVEYCT